MSIETLLTFAGIIGIPASIFLLKSFIHSIISLELKIVNAQIAQLQNHVAVLESRMKIQNDQSFIRDID